MNQFFDYNNKVFRVLGGLADGSESGFETDHRSMAAVGNTGSVSCGGPCGDQTVSGTGFGAWCAVLFFYCTFCHGAGVGVLPDGVYGAV